MIFVPAQYAPVTAAQVYQNLSGSEALIDYCMARNSDAAAQTLSIWIVPAGGVNDSSNLRSVVSIAAGASNVFREIIGDCLGNGESIWLQATAATISIKVSGRLR